MQKNGKESESHSMEERTYWDGVDFSNPYQMGPQKHRLYILDKLREIGVVTLLDVGCGTAPLYDLIINPSIEGRWDNIHKYKGTDYSWRMIETAKKLFPYGKFEVQDARKMSELDASWDCVLFMHSLDHLDDYKVAIAEAVRVSRKYIAFIFWRGFVNEGTNLNSRNEMGKKKDPVTGELLEPPWEDTHLQEYSRDALIVEFDKYNLIDVDIAEGEEVSDPGKYNFIWILKK